MTIVWILLGALVVAAFAFMVGWECGYDNGYDDGWGERHRS